jgi:hypothetical protein
MVLTGCLGQDYKRFDLELWDWHHGWMATVEPDEPFSVALWENPAFPDDPWILTEHDPAHVALRGSSVDPYPFGNPADIPEEERQGIPEDQPALWFFALEGRELGDSSLTFELQADGRPIDRVVFTIAVVEDACDGEEGLAAPRCRRFDIGGEYQWTEREHGHQIDLPTGEEDRVGLTANGLFPEAVWQVVAADSAVLEVTPLGATPSRTNGDWDTEDDDKPDLFVPIHEFRLTGRSPGQSKVAFELVADGSRIELVEYTVVVEE